MTDGKQTSLSASGRAASSLVWKNGQCDRPAPLGPAVAEVYFLL